MNLLQRAAEEARARSILQQRLLRYQIAAWVLCVLCILLLIALATPKHNKRAQVPCTYEKQVGFSKAIYQGTCYVKPQYL